MPRIHQRANRTTGVNYCRAMTLAKDPILAMDLASLESFTQEMVGNPGVVYVRVIGYGSTGSAGTAPALDSLMTKRGMI